MVSAGGFEPPYEGPIPSTSAIKYCSRCKQDKDTSMFSRKRGGLQPYCKLCSRLASKEHYVANRQDYYERNQRRRAAFRQFVADYLKFHPCVDCNESDIVVLDFDHVSGEKEFSIATFLSSSSGGLGKLKREIAKCEIRCANCHRRQTAIRGDFFRLAA